MSHLSLLRQRIKVIKTIRKTMEAMRLAARSIQIKLRKREQILTQYTEAIQQVYIQYYTLQDKIETQAVSLTDEKTPSVVVLVGSDRGLCGTFNEHVLTLFNQHIAIHPTDKIIAVGTQASSFIAQKNIQPLQTFSPFNSAQLTDIAHKITRILMQRPEQTCFVISNISRTFFLQQPRVVQLAIDGPAPDSAHNLESHLKILRIQSEMLHLLYTSLLAEQAARFLSMDSATKNADKILSQAQLEYNKLRQTQVTQELLELMGGYSD